MKLRLLSLVCLALAAGCASTANPTPPPGAMFELQGTPPNYPSNYPPPMTSLSTPPPAPPPQAREFTPPPPPPMQMNAQGWFGISYAETRNVDLDSNAPVSDVDVDSSDMPVFGGAFMRPLTGNKLQLGLEGGLSLGWQGNVAAAAVGGGGAAVAVEADMFVFELFGGPFVMWHLNPRTQLYFSTGLSLEWATFSYDLPTSHVYDDGFGDGFYARTGIEFQVSPGTWMGFGLRRLDSTIDPGGRIDSVDLRQTQYLFTVSHSM